MHSTLKTPFTTYGERDSKDYPSGVLHVAKCVSDQDSSDEEDCGDNGSGHDGDEEPGGVSGKSVEINKADLSLGVLRSEHIV